MEGKDGMKWNEGKGIHTIQTLAVKYMIWEKQEGNKVQYVRTIGIKISVVADSDLVHDDHAKL